MLRFAEIIRSTVIVAVFVPASLLAQPSPQSSTCTVGRVDLAQDGGRTHAKYQKVAGDIKGFYTYRNAPDYLDEKGHFAKSLWLWTPKDLQKIDPTVVRGLYGMTQWGYGDLLLALMPTYYSVHGGCGAFARDIETVYREGQR